MGRILCVVCLLLCMAGVSPAADNNFSFTPPATNEDGSPVFAEDLAYVFYCDSDMTGPPYAVRKDVGKVAPVGGKCTYPISGVLPQVAGTKKWWCVATAYYTFAPTRESVYSNETFFIASGGAIVLSVTPSVPSGLNTQ